MKRPGWAMVALLLAAGCEKKPKAEALEDIDFGHASPVQAEAVAPKEAPAPAAAPPAAEAPLVAPKLTISTDAAAIAQGKELFAAKGCVACHKVGGGKLVGPDLQGVTARRDQDWLSKMILHPDRMVKEDETAKKLLAEHLVPMPNQNVDAQRELPLLLAYLKSTE